MQPAYMRFQQKLNTGAIFYCSTTERGTSFSIGVIRRILLILAHSSAKKTALAFGAGLNYVVCVKYVNFLKWFGWVDVVTIDGSEYVTITERGREFGDALLAYPDGAPLNNQAIAEIPRI